MKTGTLREYVEVEAPAATQVRDDYGHRADDPSNYVSQFYVWANIKVKNDLTAELVVWHSTDSTQITSKWRIVREDGSNWIVTGAFDQDGDRKSITILAEPE